MEIILMIISIYIIIGALFAIKRMNTVKKNVELFDKVYEGYEDDAWFKFWLFFGLIKVWPLEFLAWIRLKGSD